MSEAGERMAKPRSYSLDEQVGFLLRQVHQRHSAIFLKRFADITAMQWAVMAKLDETGECSQNQLGRLVAMDVATTKGVIDRLLKRGYIETRPDPDDRRRLLISLSRSGRAFYARNVETGLAVTEETLAPLSPAEQDKLAQLLRKLL